MLYLYVINIGKNKMSIYDNVAAAKAKVLRTPSQQIQIINLVKAKLIINLEDCISYYQSQENLIVGATELAAVPQAAKTALENSPTVLLYNFHAELNNYVQTYPLPYECKNMYGDAISALASSHLGSRSSPAFPVSDGFSSSRMEFLGAMRDLLTSESES